MYLKQIKTNFLSFNALLGIERNILLTVRYNLTVSNFKKKLKTVFF